MINRFLYILTLGLLQLTVVSHTLWAQEEIPAHVEQAYDADLFLSLLYLNDAKAQTAALELIDTHWKSGYEPMALEAAYMIREPKVVAGLLKMLQEKTGQKYGESFNAWYQWLWNQPEAKLPVYANFKADLYKWVDPKFETYFKDRGDKSLIRLDEVRWGGVKQDGIPPLRNPEMIAAEEVRYLANEHVVFGMEVNGEYRAYPKRILAWHEMFVDEIGGVPVAGVYCTLCGTMVLYETEVGGVNHELGTSGFLYRSNKLMYDQATQSLWSTLRGEPVIGPLSDKGIQLKTLSVVTTTWGAWKKLHPETQVLSIHTGHRRDYSEGAAYREYFATDELMFNTPYDDKRLNNKDEVLALRFPQAPEEQLAISTRFLRKHSVYHDRLAGIDFVVLTDKSGANRVYETQGLAFRSYDKKTTLIDEKGQTWQLEEGQLRNTNGDILARLPYHRSFWFGWVAAFPDSRLIK